MAATTYIFGVEGLDIYYPGVLTPGTLLIIAGHPGSGKTTMAAQLCYHNILRGRKCLYTSFQETEEKFLKFMKRFGFEFEYFIASGSFKFSRLPLISSEDAIDGVLESLSTLILEFNPNILVVDSITPIAKVIAGDAKRRALIQNYFYNMAFEMRGLMVLIVEIPLGEHVIRETGDVEFVADGILILKHDIIDGVLTRRIEIRKLRGSPINISELPFSIVKDKGIIALVPPGVKRLGEGVATTRRYSIPCKALREALGELEGGEIVLVAGALHNVGLPSILNFASRIAFESKTGMMIVSYRRDEHDVRKLLESVRNKNPELGEVLDKTVILHLDPAVLSIDALFGLELHEMGKAKPGVVVHLDADMLKYFYKANPLTVERYLRIVKETLRSLESIAFSIAMVMDLDDVMWKLALADAALIIGDPITGMAGGKLILYRVGRESRVLESTDLLRECF